MHSYDAAVLRAAGGPALAAGVVVCGASLGLAGVPGLLGAALATAVTATVFSLTLWLCSRTRALRPGVVMAVALSGYVLVAAVLAGVLVATAGLTVIAPRAVAAGLVVGALAWGAGEMRAFARLRTPSVEPVGWATAGDAPRRAVARGSEAAA
jgi:hypothetical protein